MVGQQNNGRNSTIQINRSRSPLEYGVPSLSTTEYTPASPEK